MKCSFIRRCQGVRGRNRYGARRVEDVRTGRTWDSKGEHARWQTLRILERAGCLTALSAHPKVILIAEKDGAPEIAYHPDAAYAENGCEVWEDYKPRKATAREVLVWKLWRHFGPGPLRIVGNRGRVLRTVLGGGREYEIR